MIDDRTKQFEEKKNDAFYVSESELPDIKRIFEEKLQSMWAEDDPRSPHYKRILTRPRIRWFRFAVSLLGMIICAISLMTMFHIIGMLAWVRYILAAIFIIVYCMIHKEIILCETIRIYQHYAPDRIRNRCCCEPSCSNYMIMAIQKNGPIIGIFRGLRRLKKCGIEVSGIDYP